MKPFDENDILKEQEEAGYPEAIRGVHYFEVMLDTDSPERWRICQYHKQPVNGEVQLSIVGDIAVGIRGQKQAEKVADFLNKHFPNFINIG